MAWGGDVPQHPAAYYRRKAARARQVVKHTLTVAPRVNEASAPQDLQVAGGIGKSQIGTRSEILYALLPLAQLVEKLEPMRVAERLGDLGESGEHGLFWTLTRHAAKSDSSATRPEEREI
jgi:hypothetical protein